MKGIFLKLTSLVFPLLLLAFPASAQMPILNEFLKLNLRPANPAPFETITANIELNLTDLKKAEVAWFIDGELAESGIGNTRFEFNAGAPGDTTRLNLELKTFEGQTFRREIVIRPAEVNIVWNAETYSPPFYSGRSLFTDRSEITVSAIPLFLDSQGGMADPKNLVYSWYRENLLLRDLSGVGRDRITIGAGPITRPIGIKVVVATQNNSMRAEKTATIINTDPQVLIYEDSPLYGLLFNRALQNFELKDREIVLSAIPYSFSTFFRESRDLEYVWRQSGQTIRTTGNQSLITLRNEEQATGQAEISVSVRHKNRLLQNTGTDVSINLSQ